MPANRLRQFLALMLTFLTLTACSAARFTTGSDTDLPLTRATIADDRVALTFDVTWGQAELTRILAALEARGVQATFFVGGTFPKLYPDQVKTIAAKGHEVGTLGLLMQDLSTLPQQEVTSNLLGSQSLLGKLVGGQVKYFRPPFGPATPDVVRGARAANLVTVTHSLDSRDHLTNRAQVIAERVVTHAQRGDIILFSASDWSTETSKALPQILTGLSAKGFQFVKLSDLVPADELPLR